MEKFSKLPLSLSSSHAASSKELLHVDIWRPYKVATRQRYKFFLTLVDDHTRMVWVYLIQHKYDFLQTPRGFFAYVYNHFVRRLKILRLDNALEFKDFACNQYYS